MLALAGCGAAGPEHGGAGGDGNPPTPGVVNDGSGADVDTQTSTAILSANWSGFSDAEGAIAYYECAVGTTALATDVLGWTPVGTTTTVSAGGFQLTVGVTYYVSVRAYDLAGNVSVAVSSDGVTVQGGSGGGSTTAQALTQWGITWTFAQARQVGQFANGDWWVVGPVDVVDIAPHTQLSNGRQINGSMLNPTPNGIQGYDSALYEQFAAGRYDAALNVALTVSPATPLQLASGSLISAISQLTPATNGSLSQLRTAAVLTVLASAPADGAFRPPYSGSDKTIHFTEAQLDWTTLANVPRVGTVPAIAGVADKFARVWLDHTPGWLSRYLHPVENMPDYSRDFTAVIGTAGLLLNVDIPDAQKRDLLVRLVQLGIDDWGNVQLGCNWPGTGGQCSGRKFPILFAGRLLHDAAMSAVGTTYSTVFNGPGAANNRTTFGEDGQTFVVAETSPGVYNWGYGNYSASAVGMPEWGNYHVTQIANDNSAWGGDSYRRCCTANAWLGQALTLRIMGLRSAWNQQVFFDYLDRYFATEAPGQWTRAWEPWHETMWTAYRVAF